MKYVPLYMQPHTWGRPHVGRWQQAFMCAVAQTAADRITREAISPVNKAPLTARGNHPLPQLNSLPRYARPTSGRCLRADSKACGWRCAVWKSCDRKALHLISGPLVVGRCLHLAAARPRFVTWYMETCTSYLRGKKCFMILTISTPKNMWRLVKNPKVFTLTGQFTWNLKYFLFSNLLSSLFV